MAGLATAAVASPTLAACRNSRRFMLSSPFGYHRGATSPGAPLSAETMAESRREIQSVCQEKAPPGDCFTRSHGARGTWDTARGASGRFAARYHAVAARASAAITTPSERRSTETGEVKGAG